MGVPNLCHAERVFLPVPDAMPAAPRTTAEDTLSPKTQRTRARLFEATAQIISAEGYAAWSEDRLCALCECSRGTLRYQFPQGKYDLFPAFVSFALNQDAGVMQAMQRLSARERLYLVIASLRYRPPSPTTVAMLEIWMASRGDTRLQLVIQPFFDGADGQVLGMPDGERDPEVLALFNILVGASLSSIRRDFDAKALGASLDWLLSHLPVPPSVTAMLDKLLHARASQRFDSGQ